MSADVLNEAHYFGENEISDPAAEIAPKDVAQVITDVADLDFAKRMTEGRKLAVDIESCLNWDAGQGLAKAVDNKLRDGLAAAYPIYLHLVAGGETAWTELLEHPCFAGRKRRPKAGTEALLAVLVVAKAADTNDEKQFSDYASMLIWAEANKVAPEQFVNQVPSLKKCLDFVRKQRAEKKRKPAEAAARALAMAGVDERAEEAVTANPEPDMTTAENTSVEEGPVPASLKSVRPEPEPEAGFTINVFQTRCPSKAFQFELIPARGDQHPLAQSRRPMDMILQG